MSLKQVAVGATTAALGVLLAGYIMSQFRGMQLIDQAHDGFDS